MWYPAHSMEHLMTPTFFRILMVSCYQKHMLIAQENATWAILHGGHLGFPIHDWKIFINFELETIERQMNSFLKKTILT